MDSNRIAWERSGTLKDDRLVLQGNGFIVDTPSLVKELVEVQKHFKEVWKYGLLYAARAIEAGEMPRNVITIADGHYRLMSA